MFFVIHFKSEKKEVRGRMCIVVIMRFQELSVSINNYCLLVVYIFCWRNEKALELVAFSAVFFHLQVAKQSIDLFCL